MTREEDIRTIKLCMQIARTSFKDFLEKNSDAEYSDFCLYISTQINNINRLLKQEKPREKLKMNILERAMVDNKRLEIFELEDKSLFGPSTRKIGGMPVKKAVIREIDPATKSFLYSEDEQISKRFSEIISK